LAVGSAAVLADDSDAFEDLDDLDDSLDDLVAPLDAAAFLPIVSFRPGWIRAGSSPTALRLSEYSLFQPH